MLLCPALLAGPLSGCLGIPLLLRKPKAAPSVPTVKVVNSQKAKPTPLQKDLEQQLEAAAKDGDLNLVRECLAKGVNRQAPSHRISSYVAMGTVENVSLQEAIAQENFELLELLLENGFDPNEDTEPGEDGSRGRYTCDRDGRSYAPQRNALWFAINEASPVEIVQLLLKHGARIDNYPHTEEYPFYQACSKNADVEVLRTLLKAGADIDHQCKSWYSESKTSPATVCIQKKLDNYEAMRLKLENLKTPIHTPTILSALKRSKDMSPKYFNLIVSHMK